MKGIPLLGGKGNKLSCAQGVQDKKMKGGRCNMSDAMQSSYHGIAARLDRMPITGFHKKILWLLAVSRSATP